ncbi:MAG: hypothetical protein ACI8VT_002372, partial [Saprospiraceae bacterium]
MRVEKRNSKTFFSFCFYKKNEIKMKLKQLVFLCFLLVIGACNPEVKEAP